MHLSYLLVVLLFPLLWWGIVTLVTDFYEIRSACSMPTRELLSSAQRTQFLCVPADMSEQMLARYYTLSDDDRSLIKQHRRNHNRLGFVM